MSLLPITVRSWLNQSDRYTPFFEGLASGARVSPCAESSEGFSCAKMGALSTPVTAASSKETAKGVADAGLLEVGCMENPCSYAGWARFFGLRRTWLPSSFRKRLHRLYQFVSIA